MHLPGTLSLDIIKEVGDKSLVDAVESTEIQHISQSDSYVVNIGCAKHIANWGPRSPVLQIHDSENTTIIPVILLWKSRVHNVKILKVNALTQDRSHILIPDCYEIFNQFITNSQMKMILCPVQRIKKCKSPLLQANNKGEPVFLLSNGKEQQITSPHWESTVSTSKSIAYNINISTSQDGFPNIREEKNVSLILTGELV